MPPQQNRSLARIAAPIALVVVAIAILLVLASSGTEGGDGADGGDKASETTESTSTEKAAKRKPAARKTTYTVKTGDTLGSIAEKTGLDVEDLQNINPELDPQALVSGQKIKLRE